MKRTSDSTAPVVLHVIHQLAIGGLENGLVNLINGMPETRFRHAIACVEDYTDFSKRLARPDVEVIALRRSANGVWNVRKQLFDVCRRLRPAIVHSRNMSGLDAAFPAFLAGVRHYIHGEHGWCASDLESNQWKPAVLRRMHSPLIDRYITVSKHLQHYLVDKVGIAGSRITQIYNGVDTDRFTPAWNHSLDPLPRNFADPDSVIIGTVGRVEEIKDQEALIRAFALLSQEKSRLAARARLVIIGDGPMLPKLKELVKSLGIGQSTWLPGATSNVPEIMRSLDVFVLPSLLEGISNTILEAMATGLPIIATAVGGNVELVEDGETGRLFQPGDIRSLARLLTLYAADPGLRRVHARRARQVAVENFGLNTMVQRYQAVYEELRLS